MIDEGTFRIQSQRRVPLALFSPLRTRPLLRCNLSVLAWGLLKAPTAPKSMGKGDFLETMKPQPFAQAVM